MPAPLVPFFNADPPRQNQAPHNPATHGPAKHNKPGVRVGDNVVCMGANCNQADEEPMLSPPEPPQSQQSAPEPPQPLPASPVPLPTDDNDEPAVPEPSPADGNRDEWPAIGTEADIASEAQAAPQATEAQVGSVTTPAYVSATASEYPSGQYYSLSQPITCQYMRLVWASTSCDGCKHEYGYGKDETKRGIHLQFRDTADALMRPKRYETTHTGWGIPGVELKFGGHGLVGDHFGPLTVRADFGKPVTVSGWLTDSVPSYTVEYSQDSETWTQVETSMPMGPPLPPSAPPTSNYATGLSDRTEANWELHNTTVPEWLALPEDLRKCAERYSQSQYGEELMLLPHLAKIAGGERGGTFVEIGAYNGITFSNTLALEKCMGWKGLLIEGNPHNCQHLQANMILRPNSAAVCSAVCDAEAGQVNFTVDGGNVAGMPDTMDTDFIKAHGARNMDRGTLQVDCTRMRNLMEREASMEQADFLSLDVEGGEEFVLKASNLRDFKLMLVETGADTGKYDRQSADAVSKRQRILAMLKEAGFVKPTDGPLAAVSTIFSNEVFVRTDVARLLSVAATAAMTKSTKLAELRRKTDRAPRELRHSAAALNAIRRQHRRERD